MLADDVMTLVQNDGNGTIATNLFKNIMPDDHDAAAVVYETPGQSELVAFDGIVAERPRFAVHVRGAAHDHDTPRLRIEKIAQALRNRGAFTVNSIRYLGLFQQTPVFSMGRDLNNRWTFAVNFEAWKAPSSTV